MAEIALIRVDNRLIHGQVTANYLRALSCNRVVVIDDSVAKDKFLNTILKMAIPSTIQLSIYGCAEAVQAWKKNKFGDGNTLVIFKNISGAYETYKDGLEFDSLQIGGVAHAPGRKMVLESIALSDEEAQLLNEMDNIGISIEFQIVPEYRPTSWKKIRDKHFPDLKSGVS